MLCTVLAGADESVALLDDLARLGYPIAGALHLSRDAADEAVARLESAGVATIAVRADATVRSPTTDPAGPEAVGDVRYRLATLARLRRRNPEAYWSLVDARVGAGRMLVLLPLDGPEVLETAAFERCLARGTERVQLVDIGPA